MIRWFVVRAQAGPQGHHLVYEERTVRNVNTTLGSRDLLPL
jgi:hypothetical protein